MNHRLTHALVGIVAAAMIVATIGFSLVVTTLGRSNAETPAVRAVIPRVVHPASERMADCVRCHVPGRNGTLRGHATYGAATCLTCHQVAPAATGKATDEPGEAPAGQVPHRIVAPYADCVGCHAIGGNLSMPRDHAGHTNEDCTGCHANPAENGASAR